MNIVRFTPSERHLIDPVMFFVALIGAPLLVTALSFWVMLIPVAALFFGGPVYLITATPVLLWWLSRNAPKVSDIAMIGFSANLAACVVIYLLGEAMGLHDAEAMARIYLIFGSVFAPLWAGVFAKLYLRLRRPYFAQTI